MSYFTNAVNDRHGCKSVLCTLNTVISELYELDSGALSADPFNQSTTVTEALMKLEITSTYFADVAEKISLFRSIVCGDTFDWDAMLPKEVNHNEN
jgi:hypothetical protein